MRLSGGSALSLTLAILASAMANANYTMPEGEEFKTSGNSSEGIDWYKHVKWFISVITPQDLPIDGLVKIIGSENKSPEDIKELAMEVLKMEAGFIVFIVIGILMFLIMLFGAFISCCCFCCGQKLAPKPSPRSDRNRKIMYLLLSGLLLLLLVGVLFMYASSKGVHSAMKRSQKSLNNNLDDTNTFFRNTKKQIHYITDDAFGDTIEEIQSLLKGVGTKVLNQLETKLDTKTKFAKLKNAADEFSTVQTQCKAISNYADNFHHLCEAVTALKASASSTLTVCQSTLACKEFLDATNAMKCETNEVHSKLTQINDQTDKMKDINLHSLFVDVTDKFGNVSSIVDDHINSTVTDINDVLEDIKKEVKGTDSVLEDLTHKVSNMTADAKITIHDWVEAKQAQDINDYVFTGLNVISGIILVIWILLAFGVFFGALCYEQNSFPDERSCRSRLVGLIFLMPVFLIFLFGSLLWLFSTLLFIAGGHVQAYLCHPLYDEPNFALLDKSIEAYGRFRNINGSFLGEVMLDDSSVDLKPSSVLTSWRTNVPVYRALHLNRKFDIEDKLNYKKHYKDFESTLDKIVTANVNVKPFPEDLGVRLSEANNSFTMPDFDKLTDTLDVTQVNATRLLDILNTVPACTSPSNCDELRSKTINVTNLVKKLEDQKIAPQIDAVHKTQLKLQESLEEIGTSLTDTERKLNATISGVIETITKTYPSHITNKVDFFVQFVNSSLNEKIAGCLPLWNVYDTARTVVCKHIVDPLNGYWFGLGWCLIFLVPSMILAVYLSKHFRKLKCARSCSSETLLGETPPPCYQD